MACSTREQGGQKCSADGKTPHLAAQTTQERHTQRPAWTDSMHTRQLMPPTPDHGHLSGGDGRTDDWLRPPRT
jgi:hypothetical protein